MAFAQDTDGKEPLAGFVILYRPLIEYHGTVEKLLVSPIFRRRGVALLRLTAVQLGVIPHYAGMPPPVTTTRAVCPRLHCRPRFRGRPAPTRPPAPTHACNPPISLPPPASRLRLPRAYTALGNGWHGPHCMAARLSWLPTVTDNVSAYPAASHRYSAACTHLSIPIPPPIMCRYVREKRSR
ncbi:hypothetical protein C8J57DRAFT_1493335 [Mycena rebaudengoi]|nr:hypothetical protein C8J57DRAFT_1493335 [Mycena rebaudengoi]